jgi:AraC family transcriptional regulator, regulatory protein of adaptative response / methylated-DNA-[protein]-cysteine methyltransferase
MRPVKVRWGRCWLPAASRVSAPFSSAPTATSCSRISPLVFPDAKLVASEAAVHDDLMKVIRFVDKPANGLDLQLDLRGTPFQRRVWETLRTIPAGTTMTYAELARSIGAPNSVRAVAGACAANPIALAVPCHRVVDLAGYYWGVERMRELIKKEASA